jgi:hypothetical protein
VARRVPATPAPPDSGRHRGFQRRPVDSCGSSCGPSRMADTPGRWRWWNQPRYQPAELIGCRHQAGNVTTLATPPGRRPDHVINGGHDDVPRLPGLPGRGPHRTMRLPAEVRCQFTMRSPDGPLESAMIRCPAGHSFSGPIEFLTWESRNEQEPHTAGVASSARRDSHTGGHDGRDGSGGSVARDSPGEPGRALSCPNDAPAYYLGLPADVWIAAMSPRRRRTASHAWSSQTRLTPVPAGRLTPAAATRKGFAGPAPRTARPTRLLPSESGPSGRYALHFPGECEANAWINKRTRAVPGQ